MGQVSLSFNVDADLKRELEEEARLQHVSESDLVERALETFLNIQAHKRDVIAAAVAEADKGVFVSSEAMMAWMDRLEMDIDAPAPPPDVFPRQKA